MMDSIGSTPSVSTPGISPGATGDRGVTRVAAATKAGGATAGADAQAMRKQGKTVEAGALAKVLASTPPVNADRVTQIRHAIQNGSFPILPAKIADRLIALRLEWNPSEQA